MACYSPLTAFRSQDGGVVFNRFEGYSDCPISLPCGQCIGCRLRKSQEWALRCTHEASLHEQNCFITLTFNDDNIPPFNSLDVSHVQLFMKRLRKYFADKHSISQGIRVYYAGEYGDLNQRPHYHLIIFGASFDHDKYLWEKSPSGALLYRSPSLESLWQFGYSSVGDVNFESAGYVARYTMKKVNGDMASEHYIRQDLSTGEIYWIKPEFSAMSRAGGIGKPWIMKYLSDVYPSDFIVYNNHKLFPPRFYDNYLESVNPVMYEDVKASRLARFINDGYLDDSDKNWEKLGVFDYDSTPDRLAVRHECHTRAIVSLKRSLSV